MRRNLIRNGFIYSLIITMLGTSMAGALPEGSAAAAQPPKPAVAWSKTHDLANTYHVDETTVQSLLSEGFTAADVERALQQNKGSKVGDLKAALGTPVRPVNTSRQAKSAITSQLGSQSFAPQTMTPLGLTGSGDPTDVNTKPDQAPYTVALDHEVVSTLSGSLSVQADDLVLPGRNGLSFTLSRSYDSDAAQFFGMDVDGYGANTTIPDPQETLYPIGKGWSWNLSFLDIKGTKTYLHLAGSGTYEWDGATLKGYPWSDITLSTNTSVTVNGETSAYVLTSIQGIKQYFNAEGRMLEIADPYANTIQFRYNQQGSYGKVLHEIQDAIGNTITITYTDSKVTLVKGSEAVTYYKTPQNGTMLLTQAVDPAGRVTTYDYALQSAKFNLTGTTPTTDNPYALLTGVTYPTGAKTVYTYDATPVTRYVGSSAVNQVYRITSREDRMTNSDGSTTTVNHKNITYTGDMGSSYNQDLTVSAAINDGLTTTTFTNKKDYIDDTTPPVYYNTNVTSVDPTSHIQRSTDYTFDEARHWYWPITSSTVTTNTATSQSSTAVTTSRTFDNYANVTSSNDALGAHTDYVYDNTTHLLQSVTEPVNATLKTYTAYTRNTQGSVTQVTIRENDASGALMSQTSYSNFDAYGNAQTTTVKDTGRDIVTTTQYGSAYQHAFPTGTSVQVTDALGVTSTVTRAYTYDPATGNITAYTDGLSHTTTYQYDALGRITGAHYPDTSAVTIQYDDGNNILTTIDETGVTAVTRWNPLGWKLEAGIVANGSYEAKSKTGYDAYGRAVWSEDALGNRTTYAYDAWGRQTSMTYPDHVSASIEYDDLNRKTTTTDPEGYQTITTTDKLGRAVKQEEVTGAGTRVIATSTYDSAGHVVQSQDATGYVQEYATSYAYDVLGRLTGVTNAKQETTTYSYSMAGGVTTITFPDQATKQTRYDELGRVIETTDANSHIEQTFYDANGNRTQLIDRNDTTFTYDYNTRNWLLHKISPDGTIAFGYDAAGRRTSMTDGTGTTQYAYDPATAQLTTVTYPDERTVQYDYDAQGNRRTMTDPFGYNVYYSYDARNRLQTVGSSPQADTEATYAYFANDLLKSITARNGVTSAYTYDGLKLHTLVQTTADNTTLSSYSYAYDGNGNLTDRTENGAALAYTYDRLNRLLTADSQDAAYTYDGRGNRSSLESASPVPGPDATYTYDKRDQLTQVDVGAPINTTVSYAYNGDGLLYERTEGSVTTRYYYDGQDVIAEGTVTDGVASLKARYIRGHGLIARQDADQDEAYYLQNGHGDITELRDATGNTRLNAYSYDAWGNPLSTSETVDNPFRYSGELWDTTTKLQYLRARWYDPNDGRFINEDTYEGQIDNPLSLNLYTYVENNPLTNVDPSGHWCEATVNNVKYMHPGGCNDGADGKLRYSGPGYSPDSVHNGDYYYDDNRQVQQFFVDGAPHISDPLGISQMLIGCAFDDQCAAFVTLGTEGLVAKIDNVTDALISGARKVISWSKGLFSKGTNSAVRTLEDILENSKPGRVTKGKATQYEKSGGFSQALDDFNSMGLSQVRDIPGGKVGKLPDGRTVNVRSSSSDGRPTLEIYDGKNSVKIRY